MNAPLDDDDDDAPKKTPKATIIRRVLVAILALMCAGGLVYTRWIVKKGGIGETCSYDMHCQKDAPRCLKQSTEGDGVCSRSCDTDADCADNIKCVKVELDDYDERGRPLQGGYCFPQALLDARRKKKNDGGVTTASKPKSDSWLDVPEAPNQLEGEFTVEHKGSYLIKGTLVRVQDKNKKRTIIDTSTLRVYSVDDDKKSFAASQLAAVQEAKVTKTDRKDKVLDRECEIWQIDNREACVLKGGAFVDPTSRAATGWEKELAVRGAFPLRISEGDKPKLVITKLDLHPIDSKEFAIPKEYKNAH